MKYGIIGTWRMSYEGISQEFDKLANGQTSAQTLINAICEVENNQYYKSVGYGGLPNENGIPEFDAAFMDGSTMQIGAIAGVKDLKNPVKLAYELSKDRFNIFLVGVGAQNDATKRGFEKVNMLTERAIKHYQNKLQLLRDNPTLTPYDGHDTVGMVCLDTSCNVSVATSTSGLFMKKEGRVGDSCLSGSGFYSNSEIGGASATGLGEDIMKGCLSYETVSNMKTMTPMAAAKKALKDFEDLMHKKNQIVGAISIVAMSKDGEWGIASNVEFTFVVCNQDIAPTIMICNIVEGKQEITEVTKDWLEAYQKRITKKL